MTVQGGHKNAYKNIEMEILDLKNDIMQKIENDSAIKADALSSKIRMIREDLNLDEKTTAYQTVGFGNSGNFSDERLNLNMESHNTPKGAQNM